MLCIQSNKKLWIIYLIIIGERDIYHRWNLNSLYCIMTIFRRNTSRNIIELWQAYWEIVQISVPTEVGHTIFRFFFVRRLWGKRQLIIIWQISLRARNFHKFFFALKILKKLLPTWDSNPGPHWDYSYLSNKRSPTIILFGKIFQALRSYQRP